MVRRRFVGALVGIVILCASCSGGASSDAVDRPLAGPPLWSSFDSPLDSELGLETADPALELERMRQVRHAIQQCMNQEGFDYPVVEPNMTEDIGPGIELSEEQYIVHYGFGVYPSFAELGEIRAEQIDPVSEVLAALPPGERQAYGVALYGPISNARLGETPSVQSGSEGCAQQSEMAVPPLTAVPAATQDLVQEFETRFELDPDVRDAWSMWSECMVTAGYHRVERPGSYRDELFTELAELMGSAPIEEVIRVANERSPSERELARTSFECETESRPLLLELRRTLEQEYLELVVRN